MNKENIRRTLLLNLFQKPRPFEPSAYKKAIRKLFPGEKAFISFLKVEREEQQVDRAKALILGLIQERHFPPFPLTVQPT